MKKKGHKISFIIRDYGETMDLIKHYNKTGYVYSHSYGKGFSKIVRTPVNIFKILKYLRKLQPDIILDFGIYGAICAKIINKPCIIFTDSEPRINKFYKLQYKILVPLVELIVTPSSFRDDLGEKQVKVNSYKEFAYLHPKYYLPNKDVYKKLDLKSGEKYVVLRFNDLSGVHDIGLKGFTLKKKIELINELNKRNIKFFISFEGKTSSYLKKYELKTPKYQIHDVLFFSTLLVTDTQTMATEAAILGTPVIRCNTFVGNNDMGNFLELENKYGLIYNISDPSKAIKKTIELISINDIKKIWAKKRSRLLEEKIDINEYFSNLIEKYS